MRKWIRMTVGAIAAGSLFVVALPPVAWGGLGWICMMPVLWSTRRTSFLVGFAGGVLTATVGALLSVTPLVGPAVIEDGTIGWNFVGFGLYGLVIALVMGLAAEVRTWNWRAVFGMASLAVLAELITFVRLPAHLGLTQFASMPMMAVASIGGIWLVSWFVWAANFTILLERPRRATSVAVAALVLGTLGLSLDTLRRADSAIPVESGVGGALALQSRGDSVDELLSRQLEGVRDRPRLGVWPELAVAQSELEAIQTFAAGPHGFPIVTSYHRVEGGTHRNSAVVIDARGISEPYDKRKLFAAESETTQAGTRPLTVAVVREHVGLNICFDSCFPRIMRETALAGADVIALPTLDPASPNGFIQAVHAAFTPFRAAELGVPIVRAETTAWSMIVDARGRILGLTPTGREGPLVRRLASGSHWTLYRAWGDWFLWVCVGIAAAWIVGSSKMATCASTWWGRRGRGPRP
ncbi:MAG TPA: nitrilase-related carbon-nitrogen hydrolase [Fimbriimonadaceae bacterium]|nr:nitrilase-related carbon-nitrogen hydrolase [Fimbriimonadaceae bacterium]